MLCPQSEMNVFVPHPGHHHTIIEINDFVAVLGCHACRKNGLDDVALDHNIQACSVWIAQALGPGENHELRPIEVWHWGQK